MGFSLSNALDVAVNLASLHLYQGRHETCVNESRQILVRDPAHLRARLLLLQSLLTLGRLAEETERRGAALESARAFASSATHELRVPLQSVMTNLNLAGDERVPAEERAEVLELATAQLRRMAAALTAVRALAETEFADPSWFEPVDVVEVVDAAVAEERAGRDLPIDIVAEAGPTELVVWPDGVRLAVANLVRNALGPVNKQ